MKRRGVVLLSGGLDSATAAAVAASQGFDILALSFDYGQRHLRELDNAGVLAKSLRAIDHRVVKLDLGAIGGSALTADIDIPMDREVSQMGSEIPVTYVPARNAILLSIALSYAEVAGSQDIFIGVSAVDYSGYPDCRPAFIRAFQDMANVATKAAVEGRPFIVHAPLMDLSKAQTIRLGLELGVDYSLTWSCYAGGERPCGRCDSCRLRLAGFAAAGVNDPLEYE